MTKSALAGLVVLCLVAGAARAQRIIIVDKQGGAGAQFSEIQPAIEFAAPNDVIAVRQVPPSVWYDGFTVRKALRIVGEPGVRVGPIQGGSGYWAMGVEDLDPGEVVVLSGLWEQYVHPYTQGLVIQNNQGSVHCEALDLTAFALVSNCRQASFDSCVLQDVIVQDSDVLFTASTGTGFWDYSCGCAAYALRLERSRATLAGGTWTGSDGYSLGGVFAQPAIYVTADSRLLITGDQQTVIRAGAVWPASGAPAIRTTGGVIVRDPDPQLIPSGTQPAIAGPAVVVEARVPYLVARVERGMLLAALYTWGGATAYLFASPFVPPVALPAPLADLWVGQPVLVAAGPTANGTRVDVLALPALLPGAAVPLQSVVVWNGQVVLSNPAVPVLAH